MLAKCSNPSCGESFRYLQEGKLFRLESDLSLNVGRRPEYFWLCRNCSGKMTLRLDDEARITTLRMPAAVHPTESTIDFVALDRKQGLVLSCLRFLGHPKPESDWTPTTRGKLVYAS